MGEDLLEHGRISEAPREVAKFDFDLATMVVAAQFIEGLRYQRRDIKSFDRK